MICTKCTSQIDMVNKKNRDTGMWYNYWWCESCEAKAIPMPEEEDMAVRLKKVEEEHTEKEIKRVKKEFYDSIAKDDPIDKAWKGMAKALGHKRVTNEEAKEKVKDDHLDALRYIVGPSNKKKDIYDTVKNILDEYKVKK